MGAYGPVIALAAILVTAAGIVVAFLRPIRRGVDNRIMSDTVDDLGKAVLHERGLRDRAEEDHGREIAKKDALISELRQQVGSLRIELRMKIGADILEALHDDASRDAFADRVAERLRELGGQSA